MNWKICIVLLSAAFFLCGCSEEEETWVPPALEIVTDNLPAADMGKAYDQTLQGYGGAEAGYLWAVTAGTLPSGLTLEAQGTPGTRLHGTPVQDGTFTFTVGLSDLDGNHVTKDFTLEVRPILEITTTLLADAVEGASYAETLSATGGTGANYAWSLLSGPLPPGIALSSAGTPDATLTGVPTAQGNFPFSVEVRDDAGNAATQALSIDVLAPLVILTTALPDGLEGYAYTGEVRASGGTDAGYTWSVQSGNLPSGVILASTGTPNAALTGLPVNPGTYTFTVEVTDSGSHTAVQPLGIVVLPAGSLYITTTHCVDGFLGQAYGQMLNAIGGSGCGYTWSVASGSLPPGLTLDGRNAPLGWNTFSLSGNVDLSWSPELIEISGVAVSRRNPGVLWVHDDSGAAAVFYAIDDQGTILQKYQVNIAAQDWEDMGIGPGPDPSKEYLYIGDFGDNATSRSNYRIVRVEEPIIPATIQPTITVPHQAFYFLYPVGSRNCETLLIDWETAVVYVCEKVGGAGNVYKFPGPMLSSWTPASPVTLTQVTAGGVMPSTLTGGDASRDARRVIVRSYGGTCWEYARPAGSPFDAIFTQTPSTVSIPGGQQYEAIAYAADGAMLYTVTEKASAATVPIYRATAVPGPFDTTISGIPSAAGGFPFVIQVMDSAGNTATRAFSISVQ
ncbi:MAG: putative Ig domain-containing protein [Planctomycetota bacterium]|jgi:hypothetical protein